MQKAGILSLVKLKGINAIGFCQSVRKSGLDLRQKDQLDDSGLVGLPGVTMKS